MLLLLLLLVLLRRRILFRGHHDTDLVRRADALERRPLGADDDRMPAEVQGELRHSRGVDFCYFCVCVFLEGNREC